MFISIQQTITRDHETEMKQYQQPETARKYFDVFPESKLFSTTKDLRGNVTLDIRENDDFQEFL